MHYTTDYARDAVSEFMGQFEKDFEASVYSVTIEPDLNPIPVLDICRFFAESGKQEYQEEMIRKGILGKMVTIFLDDSPVGSFQMNNLTDPWEVFPVMMEHPLSRNKIEDVVLGYIAKKATLPRKKGASNVAAGTVK